MNNPSKGYSPLPARRNEAPLSRVETAPGAYFVTDDSNSLLGPINLAGLLSRRRWTIVGSVAAAVILTALFTSTKPTVYRSATTFLVDASRRGDTSPLEVLERAGEAKTMLTESELLQSRRVVEPVVQDLNLDVSVQIDDQPIPVSEIFTTFEREGDPVPGLYEITTDDQGRYEVRRNATGDLVTQGDASLLRFGGFAATLREGHKTKLTVGVSPMEAAVAGTQDRFSAASSDRDSDILLLTCTGSTVEEARDLCHAVTGSYLDLRANLQQAEATGAVEFFQEQLADVASRLEATEDSLQRYQEANLAVALDTRATQAVQTQASFQARRDQLQAERAALQSLLGGIQSGTGDFSTYPTLIQGNPVIGDLLRSLVELENRRADLMKTRTERNPDIVAIDSRRAEIERQLESIAANHEGALVAQISSLNTAAGQAAGRASTVPRRQIESGRLERQVSLLDETYRRLQTQLQDAQMAESITLPTVRVLDAEIPMNRVTPRWKLNIFLGLVLGSALGLGLAILQEYNDTRVRERKELEENTGIPVLAMLPRLKEAGPVLPVSDSGGNGAPVPMRTGLSQEIAREAFWSLVTDLQFAARRLDNGGLRSVAITSTTRGEGKTFSACNLAIAQASSAKRTLLVDADMRGKGATRFFKLGGRTPGLADVLSGSLSAQEAWRPLRLDGRGELHLLPAGSVSSDYRQPLNLYKLGQLLELAERSFDLVIIDTPPLNVVSDAAAVAASVDGVIVIVRGGLTDKAALDLTLDRLERSEAQVMGLVLNDVDLPAYYTSYSHADDDEEGHPA